MGATFEPHQYVVSLSDGVRISLDVFLPENGSDDSLRYPVIWTQTCYGRRTLNAGHLQTELHRTPWLAALIQAGYAVACADSRGTGDSEGDWLGPLSHREVDDLMEITAWLAAAPWSNGAVGMFGKSYGAGLQLLVAARPQHGLRCIAPRMPPFDLAETIRPGGWLRQPFVEAWTRAVALNVQSRSSIKALDNPGDPTGNLGEHILYARSPHLVAHKVHSSRLPMLIVSGWRDIWIRDALAWFNGSSSDRVSAIVGGWGHLEEDANLGRVHHEFFDRWFGRHAPGRCYSRGIAYAVIGECDDRIRRSSYSWPPRRARPASWYLTTRWESPGELDPTRPRYFERTCIRSVDPSASTGRLSRWGHVFGTPILYDRLTDFVDKGLAFASAPLERPMVLVGSPILELWLDRTDPTLHVCAVLLDVPENGVPRYITEAVACASLSDVPGEAVRQIEKAQLDRGPLRLEMHPVAYRLQRGNRLALAICGADRDNLCNDEISSQQKLVIFTGDSWPSRLVISVFEQPERTVRRRSQVEL